MVTGVSEGKQSGVMGSQADLRASLGSTPPSCMTLTKLLNLSEPQLTPLQNGHNDSTEE